MARLDIWRCVNISSVATKSLTFPVIDQLPRHAFHFFGEGAEHQSGCVPGGRGPDVWGRSMGCGRSRHRSPSLPADGTYREGGGDRKEGSKRGAKRLKLQTDKAVIKREAEGGRASPKKTTNGKTGSGEAEVKADSKGGATGREGGAKRQWQLEEAVDTPPETVMAVYKSSVPASARASLQPHSAALVAHPPPPGLGAAHISPAHVSPAHISPAHSANGSLINGGSSKTASLVHDVDETGDRSARSNATAPPSGKPVHVTSSQLEFFKMLDEKIEGGPDYFPDDE